MGILSIDFEHGERCDKPMVKGLNMKDRLFIERRDEGDYAVRKPNSQRASAVQTTQAEAIARAKNLNPEATILVERVRHTDKGNPDKWRKP